MPSAKNDLRWIYILRAAGIPRELVKKIPLKCIHEDMEQLQHAAQVRLIDFFNR